MKKNVFLKIVCMLLIRNVITLLRIFILLGPQRLNFNGILPAGIESTGGSYTTPCIGIPQVLTMVFDHDNNKTTA